MTEIRLNGERKTVKSENLAALLSELALADKRVAVERNRELVRRDSLASTPIHAGDTIEIVHFVGGG